MAVILEDDILTALLAMNAVTAIVGAGAAARIRPDAFDESDTPPAILLEVDREAPQNDLLGKGGLVMAEVTITCRAATRRQSRQLAEAVRTNGTDPGTGLAGYAGSFDAVLEDMQAASVPKGNGANGVWHDTLMSFAMSYTETT